MKALFCVLVISNLFIFQIFAGTCTMNVTRVSCPGKETECYTKCKGKESSEEIKKVGSIEACIKEASRNCVVFRKEITKTKKITATFDGKPVEGGKNFCNPVKEEFGFNTCK